MTPVNLLRFCRTPFLKNTYGGLLLDIYTITRNTFILNIFSFQYINTKQYLWKQKSVFKLVSLIISHTEVSKLYFYFYFLLFLSLSTVTIHQFCAVRKFSAWFPSFPPWSPHSHPNFPHCHHSHPDSPALPSFPPLFPLFPLFPSVPRFPIPAFTNSQFRWSYQFSLMETKWTLSLSRENSMPYVTTKTGKIIKNGH